MTANARKPFMPVMKEPPPSAYVIPPEPTADDKRKEAAEILRQRQINPSGASTAAPITAAAAIAMLDAKQYHTAPVSAAASGGGGMGMGMGIGAGSGGLKRPSRHGKRSAPESHPSASAEIDHEAVMWNCVGEPVRDLTADGIDRLKSRVVQLVGAMTRAKLPGPLPVSLGRMHLQRLRNVNYWVAEKSDGVRAMFFVCSEKGGGAVGAPFGVYFVDRKFLFRRIRPEYELLFLEAYGKSGDTLCDGELIQSLNPPSDATGGLPTPVTSGIRYNYLIYDAVCVNGKSYKDEKLSKRLQAVVSEVASPFQKQIKAKLDAGLTTANGAPIAPLPFGIRSKLFMAKAGISKLLKFISPVAVPLPPTGSGSGGGGGTYPAPHLIAPHLYKEQRTSSVMCNYNDGLIFTSEDEPFLGAAEALPLLKWKYVEKNSVDFLVTPATPNETATFGHSIVPSGKIAVALRCGFPVSSDDDSGGGGGGGSRSSRREGVFRTTVIPIEWWNANVVPHQARTNNRVICECAYNRDTGLWELLKIRSDKDTPNFLATVISTIEGALDNITTEELVLACTGKAPPPAHATAAAGSAGSLTTASKSHSGGGSGHSHTAPPPFVPVPPTAMDTSGSSSKSDDSQPIAIDYGFGAPATGGGGGAETDTHGSAAMDDYDAAAANAKRLGLHVMAYDIQRQTEPVLPRPPYLPSYKH